MARPSPSLAGTHDTELAALAAAGGRREFAELVRRHAGAVRSLLRRMGAEPALADDVAQDAFLTAFQRCAEFRGEGTFQAWVKRIAARAYVKRKAREARWLEAEEASHPAVLSDPGRSLDLDAALAALTPAERLCVSLCHGAGLTHAEIASVTEMPLGTVKSHVKRGLDKLRTRLAGPSDSGSPAHVRA